ncbi:MAG: hypothetical protein ACLFRL_07925 [Desulfohalobiaceae bacterium]
MFYVPYIIMTFSLFIWSLRQRHYRLREVVSGVLLQAICFPVYMRSALLSILGYRGSFKTTPTRARAWPCLYMPSGPRLDWPCFALPP